MVSPQADSPAPAAPIDNGPSVANIAPASNPPKHHLTTVGRHEKTVIAEAGLDRRDTGYYSTPPFVADYIGSKLLRLNPAPKTVLDPCVGRGELLRPFLSTDARLCGYDILHLSDNPFYDFEQRDFIDAILQRESAPLLATPLISPDIIVANPPYNCHEHSYLRDRKSDIRKHFGPGFALNLYSTFVAAIIKFANPGCFIGLITLDSFLTARGHETLRRTITQHCSIHSLLLCPTDLFLNQGADVRTVILILERGARQRERIEVCARPRSSHFFKSLLQDNRFDNSSPDDLVLSSGKDRREFLVSVPKSIRELFANPRLSDKFPCKTGISTGNDGSHLSLGPKEGFATPFYKNPAGNRFYAKPNAYIRDDFLDASLRIPNFIVRNRRYIGRPGITCSSMGVSFGAAILPPGCGFGVNANIFPEDAGDTWWLLSYLNSSLCNYIVRGVLLRSNMITAGYVSRIPLPSLAHGDLHELGELGRQGYDFSSQERDVLPVVRAIDDLLFRVCDMPETDSELVVTFCSDIVRLS
ncbi:MAG: N-6 DNA methylase [Gammaproteobacteria bacterium]|nr:N-6 DNA methylase [Gammaproteobacteria bacterium]